MIIKVICVENTFKFSSFKIGQISSILRNNDLFFEVTNHIDNILVCKEGDVFKYSFNGGIIRFKKYNFRKEKLERILNDN